MTDDEIQQNVLERLDEFDHDDRGAHFNIGSYLRHDLSVDSERRISRLVDNLRLEGLVQDYGQSWGSVGKDQQLTDKGRRIMENGGWWGYRKLMEERDLKATSDADLADIKARGEALQFKYWWVGLAGFAISVLTAGWTIYQDTTDDAPTRAEYNQLVHEVEILQKIQTVPVPKSAQTTKPTSLSTK